MQLWQATLLGLVLITAAVLAVFIVVLRISHKLDRITEKLEAVEWATAELERRVPGWRGTKIGVQGFH